MAVIGTLAVNVVARTKQFNDPLKGARKQLAGFGKQTDLVSKSLKAFGATLLAAVSIRAIGSFVQGQLVTIDALAKTADRLAISTEKLGAFQFAAGLAGVSVEEFNLGLDQFNRRLGESQLGSGQAKRAFDLLGLSSKELLKLSLDQRFAKVADAIQGQKDQTLKAQAAYDLFGRSGTKLLNTLELGSRGLAETEKQFRSLGLAVSREEAAKIEQFNDSLSTLKQTLGGVGRELVIDVSPEAVDFVKQLTEGVRILRSFGGDGGTQPRQRGGAERLISAFGFTGLAGGAIEFTKQQNAIMAPSGL